MFVDQAHLERLRRAEVETVREWFKPNARVLEIGGDNGFQASILSSWGCDVQAIDLVGRPQNAKVYFPVKDYDGKHIPFADSSFDMVFSSNVLEHIQPISDFLEEIRRVLTPDGMAVHILPSPLWRLWTSLTHYLFLAKHLLSRMKADPTNEVKLGVQRAMRQRGMGFVVKRVLSSGPHGEHASALSELYFFNRNRWLRLFRKNGFEPVMVKTNGLFYTGYAILPALTLPTRRSLAGVLGSACNIFVLKKLSSCEPLKP